jgi:hypothetical protein
VAATNRGSYDEDIDLVLVEPDRPPDDEVHGVARVAVLEDDLALLKLRFLRDRGDARQVVGRRARKDRDAPQEHHLLYHR